MANKKDKYPKTGYKKGGKTEVKKPATMKYKKGGKTKKK